jgi:hypothetical protein
MSRNKWFFLAATVLSAACAAGPDGGPVGGGPTGPSGGGADSGPGATGSTGPTVDSGQPGPGTDSGGGAPDSGPTVGPAVKLPFYLSDQFVPSGFMGDSTASMTAITLTHDAASCKTPRQTGAGGDCYGVVWAPSLGDAGAAWAGVYWQSSANNWGSKPGKAIAPGATKVSFYAAGAAGGEQISLCAGGINATGATATLPYSDTFTVKQPAITLTTTWTQYQLPLTGTSYTTVLGGFCWVSNTTTTENIKFYIDDVKWE